MKKDKKPIDEITMITLQRDYAIEALKHYQCSTDIPERAEQALKKIESIK